MPNIRLIPVVIFAAMSLLAIKTLGFMAPAPAPVQTTWNVEAKILEGLAGSPPAGVDPVVTGATPEMKSKDKSKGAPLAALPSRSMPADKAKSAIAESDSASERALIERLQERRQELDARARDLEMREQLLKAAEKQLDSRIGDLKAAEGGGGEATEQIKSLVVMYESMGPKEAARIFDRLDPRTMVELVNHMNPRKVAEIMAKMQPEAAERLTIELARGGRGEKALPSTDLQRIGAQGAH